MSLACGLITVKATPAKKPGKEHKKVVYLVPATGTRSPGIAYRQSAVNNSLALRPTPKPSPNPTLTLYKT